MKKIQFIGTAILTAVLFAGCIKEKPIVEENDEELITTMIVKFEPVGGGVTKTFTFKDVDGPGGNNPLQDEIALSPNQVYKASLQLLNQAATPEINITIEVEEEADAHRVYWEPSVNSNIAISNLSVDDSALPLGLKATCTTGTAASGMLTITLKHYGGNPPDKALSDLVNSSKSATDITVTFATKIL